MCVFSWWRVERAKKKEKTLMFCKFHSFHSFYDVHPTLIHHRRVEYRLPHKCWRYRFTHEPGFTRIFNSVAIPSFSLFPLSLFLSFQIEKHTFFIFFFFFFPVGSRFPCRNRIVSSYPNFPALKSFVFFFLLFFFSLSLSFFSLSSLIFFLLVFLLSG